MGAVFRDLMTSFDPGPMRASVTFAEVDGGRRYKVLLAPENVLTDGDNRVLVGPVGWREGDLPFAFSDVEGEPHEEARHVGNLRQIRREQIDGTSWVVADLDWDSDELAVEARRLVDEGRITGVSIHAAAGEGFVLCELPAEISAAMVRAAAEEFTPDECDPADWIEAWVDVEIGSATLLMLPAFEEARVIVAAVLDRPPKAWFRAELTEPTPLTITEEGQVFGHLALWDSCHRGFNGQCVTPPRGSADYREFHTNARIITDADGTPLPPLPVGCLTMDVSHAGPRLTLEDARRHYDHSGTVFAFVRAGEDEHGIWVAGAIRPDLEPAKVEFLRRLSLSGDWRPKGGKYHLVAAQAVPVPGFPIRSLVADGRQVELTTLGPTNRYLVEPPTDMALVADALALIAGKLDRLTELATEAERMEAYRAAMAAFDTFAEAEDAVHGFGGRGVASDDTPWDGAAAMAACTDADCYRAICAGERTVGEAAERQHWALPHHRTAGAPANAAGVRNARARFAQTEGLADREATRRHLFEVHQLPSEVE